MKFTLPLPPPLNQCYRIWNNRFLKAQPARDWEEEVGWQFKGMKTLIGPIAVEVQLYLKHRRDIDSSLKLVLDVMEKCGIYKNDNQIELLVVRKYTDKDNPRMELTLSEIVSEETLFPKTL